MTITLPTVDLTRQALKLVSRSIGGADEVWADDALIDALARQGIISVSLEGAEPSNTRKLWYDRREVPTGKPGTLKRWDDALGAWVKLTADGFLYWETTAGRAKWWYASKYIPVEGEVLPGDYLVNDDDPADMAISLYYYDSATVASWHDVTGGGIARGALERTAPASRRGDGLPPQDWFPCDGSVWRNDLTSRVYQYWAGTGWQDISA